MPCEIYSPWKGEQFSNHGGAVSNGTSGGVRKAEGVPQSRLEDVSGVLPDAAKDIVAGLSEVGILVNLNKSLWIKISNQSTL